MKPYIGVTGFSSVEEIEEVSKSLKSFPGYYMFGFTCSNKRMLDPKSSGKTSPSIDELKELVDAVPADQLPMIHYFTPKMENVGEDLEELFYYCNFDNPDRVGVQFNAYWPPLQQLNLFRISHPKSPITLQLPKKSLDYSDEAIVSRLKTYEGVVDYALIDPSGEGVDFDVSRATALMVKIQEETNIVPGVAGGFSAENVAERCVEISEEIKEEIELNFCIDAQGNLRSRGDLDTVKAKAYIEAASDHA